MTLGIRGWRRPSPPGGMAIRGERRADRTGRLVFGIRPRLVLLVLVALVNWQAPLAIIDSDAKVLCSGNNARAASIRLDRRFFLPIFSKVIRCRSANFASMARGG